ncbi:hypothetical protein NI390_17890 [Vibrio fluvialis]|uniref:hypothetical protein n=1 Tax=Vibrio fluvialis TaxID=676 RepID=UPI0027E53769|nr:hypothetical protein [Vibrio fluvialis]WMN58153.1 hypothetical protein NI390_17890 [Vibrio fluvialis]
MDDNWNNHEQYMKLLKNLETLGTHLQESHFAEFENKVISFNYLSYDFTSKFHAVIFEGELVLKVRFETRVFEDSTFHFDLLIHYFGKIISVDNLVPEHNVNQFTTYTVSNYFNNLLYEFVDKSDFFHEDSI